MDLVLRIGHGMEAKHLAQSQLRPTNIPLRSSRLSMLKSVLDAYTAKMNIARLKYPRVLRTLVIMAPFFNVRRMYHLSGSAIGVVKLFKRSSFSQIKAARSLDRRHSPKLVSSFDV